MSNIQDFWRFLGIEDKAGKVYKIDLWDMNERVSVIGRFVWQTLSDVTLVDNDGNEIYIEDIEFQSARELSPLEQLGWADTEGIEHESSKEV